MVCVYNNTIAVHIHHTSMFYTATEFDACNLSCFNRYTYTAYKPIYVTCNSVGA